ncbi:hypothetical protein [uncultured Methanobrevibacter sp.]|uniref:hypothetical protein n=1 Tax=uncultured Methanobrevibacter sp. TaxID=253161 RepID=UPI0025E9A19D|nr:hypothetical protein [uncultured Methanobrevibacter sp.]
MSNKPVLQEKDCDYSILTHVNLGMRIKDVPSGWALNLFDIREFIPVLRYEKECYIRIRGIISPCRIVINPRLFYKGKPLKNHLRDLKSKDENFKVPIEIKFNKRELDASLDEFNSDNINYIDTDLLVGKSYSSKGWGLSKDVVSQLIPLKAYDFMFPVYIDNIPAETRLNMQTRLFYNSVELSKELEELSKRDSKQRVDARIIFNEEYLDLAKKFKEGYKSESKCTICGNSLDCDSKSDKCFDCLDKEITVLKLKKILEYFKPSETFNERDLLDLGYTKGQIIILINKLEKYDLISIDWDGSFQLVDETTITNFIKQWG